MAMDFISGPTAAPTTVAGVVTPRTPDSDTDTPPHPPPSKRAHHYVRSNGGDCHGGDQNQRVSYKECMRNHAASIGGHALDGCCEFMPGPTANALDPTSLTCAACGCHRNFHRRDPDDPTPLHHLVPHSTAARRPHSPPSASQLLLSLSGHAHSPPDHATVHNSNAATSAPSGGAVMMGFYNTNNGGGGQNGNIQSKKRFRTKFSQEQKEKMYDFSEKIGWKLKKGEERLVQEFCQQVGVDRSVFKVWMHNNKHSSSASASGSAPVTISASASPQRRDKTGIIATTTTTTTTATTAISGASTNGNTNNNSNVGLNCGGVIASALEFNFANGAAQEAKAQ